MKIDFHVHSHHSRCSGLDPREAIKRAEEIGLDAIAIISHDIKPIKYKSKKVIVIPGVEVSTKQGHIIVLNTTKEFPKGVDAQELINKAPKDALIIIAHPFDTTRKGVGNHLKKLKGYHAIEVNARCLSDEFNNKARDYAYNHNIPLVAGSDSHFVEELGGAHTIVNAKTINGIIKKVKQGKTRAYLKKRTIRERLYYYIRSALGLT